MAANQPVRRCQHGQTGQHSVNLHCPGGTAERKCQHGHVYAHEHVHIVMGREVVNSCSGGAAAVRCQHNQISAHNAPWTCSGP